MCVCVCCYPFLHSWEAHLSPFFPKLSGLTPAESQAPRLCTLSGTLEYFHTSHRAGRSLGKHAVQDSYCTEGRRKSREEEACDSNNWAGLGPDQGPRLPFQSSFGCSGLGRIFLFLDKHRESYHFVGQTSSWGQIWPTDGLPLPVPILLIF